MVNSIINLLNSSSDTIFWISAIVGTTLFLLRLIMSFFGGGFFEHDADLDDLQDYGDHHGDTLFKFFTMHSLSGFLMMFGWAGLACTLQFGMSLIYVFAIALGCGLAMLLITALIMRTAMVFQDPGAVFSSKKTIGLVGTVY